jgi:hypothetical protein
MDISTSTVTTAVPKAALNPKPVRVTLASADMVSFPSIALKPKPVKVTLVSTVITAVPKTEVN